MKTRDNIWLLSALRAEQQDAGKQRPELASKPAMRLCRDGRLRPIRRKETAREFLGKFWSKVTTNENGCWNWTGYRDCNGYGDLSFNSRHIKAHKASFIINNMADPHPLCVLHTCDNPPCVNPAHLFLGTLDDNNKDRARKGRTVSPHGENHNRVKLKEVEVLEIIKLGDGLGQSTPGLISWLSRKFDVSRHGVQQVLYGESWKWITLKNRTPFRSDRAVYGARIPYNGRGDKKLSYHDQIREVEQHV